MSTTKAVTAAAMMVSGHAACGGMWRHDGAWAARTPALPTPAVSHPQLLVDDGKVTLNDPVSMYIPEFKSARVLVPVAELKPTDKVLAPPEGADYTVPEGFALVAARRPITIKHTLQHTGEWDGPGQDGDCRPQVGALPPPSPPPQAPPSPPPQLASSGEASRRKCCRHRYRRRLLQCTRPRS